MVDPDEDDGPFALFGVPQMDEEDAARRAAGGRMLCADCGERSLVEFFNDDLREYDSFLECDDCGYLELFR